MKLAKTALREPSTFVSGRTTSRAKYPVQYPVKCRKSIDEIGLVPQKQKGNMRDNDEKLLAEADHDPREEQAGAGALSSDIRAACV